jgi:hypothetical protein
MLRKALHPDSKHLRRGIGGLAACLTLLLGTGTATAAGSGVLGTVEQSEQSAQGAVGHVTQAATSAVATTATSAVADPPAQTPATPAAVPVQTPSTLVPAASSTATSPSPPLATPPSSGGSRLTPIASPPAAGANVLPRIVSAVVSATHIQAAPNASAADSNSAGPVATLTGTVGALAESAHPALATVDRTVASTASTLDRVGSSTVQQATAPPTRVLLGLSSTATGIVAHTVSETSRTAGDVLASVPTPTPSSPAPVRLPAPANPSSPIIPSEPLTPVTHRLSGPGSVSTAINSATPSYQASAAAALPSDGVAGWSAVDSTPPGSTGSSSSSVEHRSGGDQQHVASIATSSIAGLPIAATVIAASDSVASVSRGETGSDDGISTPRGAHSAPAPLPAPAPIPAGSSSSAAGSAAGFGSIIFLSLAGLLAWGAPQALRRLRLASESQRPAPFVLIADRPG